MSRVSLVLPLLVLAVHAATLPMDSVRGDKLFQTQGCVHCHRLKGVGAESGKAIASDLGRVLDRGYTPADLASTMWNHAPTMWSVIQQKEFKVGELDPQAAADLFASFYSARYFEPPGDAGRGKRVFTMKSCANCHGLATSSNPEAKPVSQWMSISDPVALVAAMWNHSPDIRSELAKKNIAWPLLNAQDLSDLLVYLRNISPAGRATPATFQITAGEHGAALFESKGCAGCHKALPSGRAALTLTAVAASMWNHGPLLHQPPPRVDAAEMRDLLSFYWAEQFFQANGDVPKGRRLFAAKHCIECHSGSGPGPSLAQKAGAWNGITMVSGLWRHGPAMLSQMNGKKIYWPVFKAGEMADLIAYLNAGNAGKNHGKNAK